MDDFDENLWERVRNVVFTRAHWERAPSEADAISRILNLAPGARILDIPCGTGRHSLALAHTGYRVTGVERCVSYLQEAKALASERALDVEWVHADMRAFYRPGYFDAVINVYTSFGYFTDPDDDLCFLQNMRASLRSGGLFLIDLTTRENVARSMQQAQKICISDDTTYGEKKELINNNTTLLKEIIITHAGKQEPFTWQRRIYSTGEMLELLGSAGFTNISTYSNFNNHPYSDNSERLVLIGESS